MPRIANLRKQQKPAPAGLARRIRGGHRWVDRATLSTSRSPLGTPTTVVFTTIAVPIVIHGLMRQLHSVGCLLMTQLACTSLRPRLQPRRSQVGGAWPGPDL